MAICYAKLRNPPLLDGPAHSDLILEARDLAFEGVTELLCPIGTASVFARLGFLGSHGAQLGSLGRRSFSELQSWEGHCAVAG